MTTQGFNNVMFWIEVDNMICLEPITQYPNLATQNYSEENMRVANGLEQFQVVIEPFKSNVT